MNGTFNQLVDDGSKPELMQSFMDDDTNPSLDLPSKVLFPKLASDIVKTVQPSKSVSRTAATVIQVHQARRILSS